LADLPVGLLCRTHCLHIVIASGAKQSIAPQVEEWIAPFAMTTEQRADPPIDHKQIIASLLDRVTVLR
jgi:hypothetical protein